MIKITLFPLLIFIAFEVQAQRIVYDLPNPATKKIQEYVAQLKDTTGLAALMDKLPDGIYLLSILEKDNSGSEGSRLINELLINQTSRFIRVGNFYIRLITAEDFIFADLGTVAYPTEKTGKRKVGKRKVLMNHDGFTIKFDSAGKLY